MSTITLTADTFEDTVTADGITFVDFWASWCAPCRAFAPVFEKASATHPDVRFGKVDTEAEQELAAAAQITAIPTLMAFKDGVLVYREAGALREKDFESLIAAVRELDLAAAMADHAHDHDHSHA